LEHEVGQKDNSFRAWGVSNFSIVNETVLWTCSYFQILRAEGHSQGLSDTHMFILIPVSFAIQSACGTHHSPRYKSHGVLDP